MSGFPADLPDVESFEDILIDEDCDLFKDLEIEDDEISEILTGE
ncbi:MAG: hypothetical protein WCT46_06695 [Candidatus Gracilibacteria bacterium]|jgi:hypothetical protein